MAGELGYGEGARKPSKKEAEEIVKEARERLQQSWEKDKRNREESATDLRFLANDQWPDDVKREREQDGRPMLTINTLNQYLRQVTNDIRQADLSIKVSPVDDQSDPDLAKVFNGLLKQIQYQSSAKAVYAASAEHQCGCGIGWFRVTTQYIDDSVFDQEIRLKSIPSPLSVYDDPAAVEPDRSDSMWRLITQMVPKATFKLRWPKAAEAGVDKPSDGAEGVYWFSSDEIRVAEYWRKIPVKKMLGLTQDGQTVDLTEIPQQQWQMLGITRTRECDTHRVEQCLLSGSEVLEGMFDWAGKYLPQVPVIGSEIPVDNGTYRHGVIRMARDPAQLYNYAQTAIAEWIALSPKAPYLVTPKQIQNYQEQWATANLKNRPFLLYEPDPSQGAVNPPKREHPPEIPAALIQQTQSAAEDIKRTTGMYDASVGARSNETSGIAIARRQLEGDVANYHYADNLQRSLEYAGRVLIDLIPKIYDTERIIRLQGEDEEEEFVPINKVIGMNPMTGEPIVQNDLSAARFDVRVTIGPSHTTKRLEQSEMMVEFMKMLDPPQRSAVVDLLAKAQDWDGAEQIAKRLHNMVPPQVLVDPDDPEAPPPPNPLDDPAVKAELDKLIAEAMERQEKARLTAAQADEKEMQNALTAGQAASGLHPTQQHPLQEKTFDAEQSERDAQRTDQHRYEDRQWSVEDQRRQAAQTGQPERTR